MTDPDSELYLTCWEWGARDKRRVNLVIRGNLAAEVARRHQLYPFENWVIIWATPISGVVAEWSVAENGGELDGYEG